MSKAATRTTASSSGIGFFGILFLILFVLKLGVFDTQVQDWSWWWVTAPLWGPLAFVIALLVIAGALYLIGKAIVAVVDAFRKDNAA